MFDWWVATGSSQTRELASLAGVLARLQSQIGDVELVDRIRLLEELKSAAGAAQARMTAAFVDSQRRAQQAAGTPAERVGQGIAAQVALARRDSPSRASRYVGWAKVLVAELPGTYSALERGETTEWRAMIVARETIWLSSEHRAAVDAALAPRLSELGDRQVESETRKLAYGLDPAGFVARSRKAANDRRVSLRPAPDTMTRLSALVPAAQGVAAYAALSQAAAAARAAGDERGRGQVMADTLVERVTGQATADAVAVEVNLVMTDHTLFRDGSDSSPDTPTAFYSQPGQRSGGAGGSASGDCDEPAHLAGYGPLPAGLARDLVRDTCANVWIRRLYGHPQSGELAGLDSRRRIFDGAIRHAVVIRDEFCRTPWCGAPIRHADHVVSVADGGETSIENGAGLCEACNYLKEVAGWQARPGPGGAGQSVIITTPTGHTYTSRPPRLPGASRHHADAAQRAGPVEPRSAESAAA